MKGIESPLLWVVILNYSYLHCNHFISMSLQWFVQMTMALHHIHSKKVLHRCVKLSYFIYLFLINELHSKFDTFEVALWAEVPQWPYLPARAFRYIQY